MRKEPEKLTRNLKFIFFGIKIATYSALHDVLNKRHMFQLKSFGSDISTKKLENIQLLKTQFLSWTIQNLYKLISYTNFIWSNYISNYFKEPNQIDIRVEFF